MRISTRGRYALRLMTDVALHSGTGYVSLKDAAERQGLSVKYLEQIAGLLGKAGFLRSGRGAQGARSGVCGGRGGAAAAGGAARCVCRADAHAARAAARQGRVRAGAVRRGAGADDARVL